MVEGNFELFDAEGNEVETKSKVAICRCGASEDKPFCNGSHLKIGFQG
ncbi:iron-binding zinc finger CDGSH type [bacterium BMS3Abin04]|nr:iron-binding zinc finger CDGSH type [bacterium BMS3Abin04]